jgi:hypothetical protein
MTEFTQDPVPTQYAEAGGIRFAYRRLGVPERPPLVFFQHFMGTLDDHDLALSDAFAVDREVILFNNAGRATAGVGLVAAIMLVLGNPLSGATSAPEMLPAPRGQIGQWLPPSASATLLRAVGYFNGARAGLPWAVLAAWAGTGLTLVVFSAARRPGSAAREDTASTRALPIATGS